MAGGGIGVVGQAAQGAQQQPMQQPMQQQSYGGGRMYQQAFGGGFNNPYQPQRQSMFDQRAMNANPQGFQNYMQQMQQREQQMPGSTMMGQQQQQPQQLPWQQSSEWQGYQTQMADLQNQLNQSPIMQQIQQLQNKMQGYQQQYAPQQRSSDGLMGLARGMQAMYGGRGFDAVRNYQQPHTMD